MKKFLVVVLASAALALSGCGTMFSGLSTVGVSKDVSPAQQKAQASINEANILITATANVVVENVKAGIMTKAEGQGYVNKLREFANRVDDAQALVNSGLPDAQSQAELVHRLVLALHREVAAKARGQ